MELAVANDVEWGVGRCEQQLVSETEVVDQSTKLGGQAQPLRTPLEKVTVLPGRAQDAPGPGRGLEQRALDAAFPKPAGHGETRNPATDDRHTRPPIGVQGSAQSFSSRSSALSFGCTLSM